jgi:hypothetical protein
MQAAAALAQCASYLREEPKKWNFHRTLTAAAALALLGMAALPTHAQQTPPPASAPQSKPTRSQLSELMSTEERAAYRQQMQEAKTPEERAKLRDAHRAEIAKRAKDKGIELPQRQAGKGPDGTGKGGQKGVYAQLFSEQERNDFRGKMQAAKTPEERTKLRDEQRVVAQARAKEKGITLPEPRRAPAPKAQQSG